MFSIKSSAQAPAPLQDGISIILRNDNRPLLGAVLHKIDEYKNSDHAAVSIKFLNELQQYLLYLIDKDDPVLVDGAAVIEQFINNNMSSYQEISTHLVLEEFENFASFITGLKEEWPKIFQVDARVATLVQRHSITKNLGSGGFAQVVRRDIDDQGKVTPVAVKIHTDGRYATQSCLKEKDILRQLSHPNVVSLYAVIKEKETLALVLEYMNDSLRNFLTPKTRTTSLPIDIALEIMQQIVAGIAYLHDKKIIHKDIKPENILITEHQSAPNSCSENTLKVSVKLADFGSALQIAHGQPGVSEDYKGTTQAFWSPEAYLPRMGYGGYVFRLMSTIRQNQLESYTLYLVIEDDQIKYRTTLTPGSAYCILPEDCISDKNRKMLFNAIKEKKLSRVDESCKKAILDFTSKTGHTRMALCFVGDFQHIWTYADDIFAMGWVFLHVILQQTQQYLYEYFHPQIENDIIFRISTVVSSDWRRDSIMSLFFPENITREVTEQIASCLSWSARDRPLAKNINFFAPSSDNNISSGDHTALKNVYP